MGSMEDAFRKAGVTPAEPEPPPEKQCAKCGKTFRPARPQHKLCEECIVAARAERATESAARPAERPAGDGAEGDKPAESAAAVAPAPPRPRADREPGREHSREPGREHPREPGREHPREHDRERPPRRERPQPERAGESAPARRTGVPPRGAWFQPRGLPAGYLENGYFTPGGSLRRELFTDWAEQIAHAVAVGPTDPTAHQLRAFHNHVKRAAAAVKFGKRPVEPVLNEIRKMKPFAAERASRRKVSDQFRQFVEANVDRVTDEKTLQAFAEHFQAVVSYAGGLLQSRKERR